MAILKLFVFVLSLIYLPSLTLSTLPKLMPQISSIDLSENMTYMLVCNLASGSNIIFDWTHNGIKLVNGSNIKIDNSNKISSLTFKNVKQENAGLYECRATNSIGKFDFFRTKINVHGKLLIKLIYISPQYVALSCRFNFIFKIFLNIHS